MTDLFGVMGRPRGQRQTTIKGGACVSDGDVTVSLSGTILVETGDDSRSVPLTLSDLLARYRTDGRSVFRDLDGHYALAIWDARDQTLYLTRDIFGVKTLAYVHDGETLAFASEYKTLVSAEPGIRNELDRQAIDHFLATGWAPPKTTFFSCVRTLLPGAVLVFRRGEITLVPPSYADRHAPAVPISSASLTEAVERAVAAQCYDRDRRYGVMLSSGVDSATIAACLMKSVPELHSFTVGYGPDDPEIVGARETAHHLGTIHHELVITPDMLTALLPDTVGVIDNPGGYDEFPCLLALHREAARHVDVIFSGNAIDTLFAGMPYHRDIPAGKDALFDELRATLVNRDERMGAQERLAAASGLSFRMPYTDRHLIDLALATPDSQKLGPAGNKLIFREAAGALLPPVITSRPKRIQHLGYGEPMARWLAEQVDRVLASPKACLVLGEVATAEVERLATEPLDAERFRLQWNAVAIGYWADIYLD